MPYTFASRAQNLKPSDIRELLKIAQNSDVISFAGGNPDPALFPVDAIRQAACRLMDQEGRPALQYGPTEGYLPLRQQIIENRMTAAGVTGLTADSILVTGGSQQGLDLLARAFLDKGDTVVCERPTYSGAINAFRTFQPVYRDIEMDDEGIRPDLLEEVLRGDSRVKFIYVIPDFQNPSGRVMSLKRRKELLALAQQYRVPVIEDAPYSDIAFEERLPSLKSLDSSGLVVYNGSFSKILSPGIRVAWVCADPAIVRTMATLKQGADLQTSSFTQRLVSFYMRDNDLNADIRRITALYRARRDAMMRAIREHFPEEVEPVYPKGGFFTWMELRKDLTAHDVLQKAIPEKVLFVPGRGFFANPGGENYARMSYVTVGEEKIAEGVARLGRVLKAFYH